jgi:DNA-3-methyladenine glycosylase II
MLTFSRESFHSYCDELTSADPDLLSIVQAYGYPPLWHRPDTFETLVQIILEQQVSLASARAALDKLQERVGNVTPQSILDLSEAELRACYFSRQKASYVRHIAEALLDKRLNLDEFELLSDDEVRSRLTNIKGIGNWTADIYLILVLQRADIFPIGDLAAVSALKQIKQLPRDIPLVEITKAVSAWQPHRTIATMLLWHYYLSSRRKPEGKSRAGIGARGGIE